MSDSSAAKRSFARIDRLPPYVFNVTAELKLAARRRGEDIIDMSMGNPDGPTPAHIVAKLIDAAQRPDTHGYSTSKGIPRLRRAISHWYESRYDACIDPDHEAVVTIGSKEGLAHLMLAVLDRGDTVLVQLLAQAKVSVSPGIGFGDYGDGHVRFALIENENRVRQAVRGIKSMLRQ